MSKRTRELSYLPLGIAGVLAIPLYYLAAEYQDLTIYGTRLAGPFILLFFGYIVGCGLWSIHLATKR